MAVLRDAAIRHVQVRQNFDSDSEVVVNPSRQIGGVLQQAVDAITDSRAGTARLDVNIARTERCGFGKNHFLNADDRGSVAIRIARRRALNQSR